MEHYIFFLLLSWLLWPGVLSKTVDIPQCNVEKLCAESFSQQKDPSELDLLQCLLYDKFYDLTAECMRNSFEYARNYFSSKQFTGMLSKSCSDLDFSQCKPGEKLIICALNQKEKLTEFYCEHLIVGLERLIRAHFSLVSDFVRFCENDVKHLCSHQHVDPLVIIMEDNKILDCLQKSIDFISNTTCQQEIFYISEIQGESINLDNNLLQSYCSKDTISFCPLLSHGSRSKSSDVFKCLLEFINDPNFSFQCREEIFKKEKLVSKDSKVSKGLMRDCRDDIRKNHCRRMISEDKTVRLAQVLLCLENAIHNGSKISSDCRSEMIRHRKLLLEDYRLSPEVVSKCSFDVKKLCDGVMKNGRTIHCLMENSKRRRNKERVVSAGCQRSLEDLLKTTDVGEDWRVDPVVRSACEPVVRNLCDEAIGDETKVMSCLMDNINLNSNLMSKDCANAVMQIQYFASRNFKLDSLLFEACRDDAVVFCHAKHAWNDEFNSMDPERGPLILPCLYRYAYGINADSNTEKIKLKSSCEKQVRRVMRQRALRAELIPEVEESCFDDLTLYCSEKVGPGKEMLCLQDKYSSLTPKCRYVVGNFTEAEASDINLNPIVKTFCKPVINEFCKDEMRRIRNESTDVMSCLIKHKNDEEMKIHYKCRAAIEHFQLITLNDYHFTVAFKDACRPYVLHYCPKAHTKAQVVECLSEVTQNDTLKDERYKLSKECRYQLRAQLLQQREFIDLDPKLKSACEKEIKTSCKKDKRNYEVLECLEENINILSSPCQKAVFHIEQHDFKDSSTDYTLITMCKEMIKSYCKGDITLAFVCLKKFKDDPLFDNNCRSIVLKRMVEQSSDYRLNPVLQRSCSQDIGKFCISLLKNHIPDTEFEGKVLNCLKIKFRERKLRKDCEIQLVSILKESALNYKLNPLLRNLCFDEIQNICGNEVVLEKVNNSGQVEECLKVAFVDGRITNRACRLEVAGLIEEAKADIHVDPLLHRACALDVTKYCIDVPPGAGRILQCLQNVMSSKKELLQSNCKLKLSQRMEMFKNAEISKNQELKNFNELVYQLKQSPSRKYFVVSLFSVVGVVFMLGLYCGRVSRKYTALKRK